jgi:hypothetical protein
VEADALRERARAALAEEFGNVGFAVMKDPRMCRLMPFWAPMFAEAKWSVRALLPIRSPLEVSQSLTRRDGLSPAYGCLLWLRHVLDAELETRSMARAVLDWTEFLGDRRETLTRVNEQWGLIWPNWHEDAFSEVDEFVSADLRRQRSSEAELEAHSAVNDLVRRTYAAMIGLVRDSRDDCVLQKLDDLRAAFETASAIFDVPMRESAEEGRRIRSEATAEITRAEDIMDRGKRKSRGSMKAGSRSLWKPRSKAHASPRPSAKALNAIRNSLFFNSAHYLKTNPDVCAAGLDAALHYLIHGGREGRDPGPFFSTKAYLARYPDVAEANVNALLHYETQGRRENRVAAT